MHERRESASIPPVAATVLQAIEPGERGTALQETVEQIVTDSYAGLEALIQRKYAQVDVNQFEAHSYSKNYYE